MRNNKKFITVVALLLLAASFITVMSGCAKEKEPYKPPVITTQYTVSYYKEDGTTLIETRTFTHGDYITYPSNLDKDGYFTQWKLYNEAGEEIGTDKAIQNTKAVLYYELTDALVTVRSSIDDGELFNRYYYYGDTFNTADILAEIEIERPGYVFKGFSEDGGENFVTVVELKGSITIYAMYEAIPYDITFFDDETYRVIYNTTTTVYGEISLPAAPAKEGYTFDGWYVSDPLTPGGSKRVGGKGDTYLVTGNTDFYAVYTENKTENK